MELITTITEKKVLGREFPVPKKYSFRKAGRAVVFNSENKIAILHATKSHFHKLPGGGVEKTESIEKTLERELVEEIGCKVDILREIGKIVEIKNKHGKKQTSYCFMAEVLDIVDNNLTEKESKILGLKVKWVSLEEAIKIFEKDKPEDYTANFIRYRDLEFLKKVRSKINAER